MNAPVRVCRGGSDALEHGDSSGAPVVVGNSLLDGVPDPPHLLLQPRQPGQPGRQSLVAFLNFQL